MSCQQYELEPVLDLVDAILDGHTSHQGPFRKFRKIGKVGSIHRTAPETRDASSSQGKDSLFPGRSVIGLRVPRGEPTQGRKGGEKE